jgi:hypothetical protein
MHKRRRRLGEPLLVRRDDIGFYIPVGDNEIDDICKSGKLDIRQLAQNGIAATFESMKALAASYPPAHNYPEYKPAK